MKASGPISGSSSCLPNVMLRPDKASMMKQVAVIQCTKRSNALKRTTRAPGPPDLDPHHAADQIEDHQQREHAEDGDAADPAQRHLVEVAPVAPGRLLDGAGLLVGHACTRPVIRLSSLEQLSSLDRARGRIDRTSGLRCWAPTGIAQRDDECERQRADDETHAHEQAFAIPLPPCSPSGVARLAGRTRASTIHDAIVSR